MSISASTGEPSKNRFGSAGGLWGTYWHVGQSINIEVLQGERAAYGQQVIASVAESLVAACGKSSEAKNLRRMMQFAEIFSDLEIVVPLARQLS